MSLQLSEESLCLPKESSCFPESLIYHHVVPLARISLTLSHHFSLSFIASGRSSGLHPVSSHSCCMYVRAGHPAFARPYAGVHRSTTLMSSSLLLQQCPACLVRLAWIIFVIGGRWPYSWCLVRCCCQDLFYKFYTIFLSQMTWFKTTNADSLMKRPTFSYTNFPLGFCILHF